MEAVPIARVVFVVRVPVLDKESEAKPTASVLPAFQGLGIVRLAPGGGVIATQTGLLALKLW